MDDLAIVKAALKEYPDFPKPGILFQDIFSIFNEPTAHQSLHNLMVSHSKLHCDNVDVIVGLDSRGFLLGPAMALAIKKPFVPIRKAGKLPGKCLSQTYTLEYGTDQLEIQDMSVSPGARVMIVDDLLATGGTMKTACDLVKKVGGVVDHCWVVMELAALGGRGKVGQTVEALITLADVV